MTGAVASRTPRSPGESGPDPRWLLGPVPDLLFGCGLGYVAWIGLLAVPGVGASFVPWVSLAVACLTLVTNTPHYGATLLRVYASRSARRRYVLFAVHMTLIVVAVFVGGVYWTWLGHLLVTLYVTWSPWHFAGQNYGLAVMFLRRRGVRLEGRLQQLLYLSFGLSFGLAFLALHGGEGAVGVAPVPDDVFGHYRFLSLGIPTAVLHPAFAVIGVVYLGVLAALAAAMWRRARHPADLLPSALLVALQAFWFSIPALLSVLGSLSVRSLVLSTIWVSMAHSVQYLWVTRYYAGRTEPEPAPRYFAKTLLAGSGVLVLPALPFAPGLLGTVPYHVGLAGLLFAAVNVHHFMLDGAIWKLRDGRIAKVLLRSEVAGGEDSDDPRSSWLRKGVWAACALGVVVSLVNAWELEFGVSRAIERGDFARLQQAEQRLRWIGRESEVVHYRLGLQRARTGQTDQARRELQRSLDLYPRAETWTTLGNLERLEGRFPEALDALARALLLDPGFARAHLRRGETLAQMGRRADALAALEEARRLAPEDPQIGATWRILRRRGLRDGPASRELPLVDAPAVPTRSPPSTESDS